MGAMITVYCDSNKVSDEQSAMLAKAIIELVAEELNDEDVFVYVNRVQVSIAAAPIEVMIQVSRPKVADATLVLDSVSAGLKAWKQTAHFTLPINLNIIPVEWYTQIGI